MAEQSADVAIVGAGILGLAHAFLAARAGKSVVVFDRSPRAQGASVRNFGMIWPVGQPAGEMLNLALRSRELWLELLRATKLPCRETGSLHVAYRDDEAEVAQEFADLGPRHGYQCRWLASDEVQRRSPAIKPHGLLGGLWSDTEFTIDPRQILASLPLYLEEQYGIRFVFGTHVKAIELPRIETTAGRWNAEKAIVCSGEEFQSLYAGYYAESGLTRCKLQMMRTPAQPSQWQLGPSLAAGLTLRFYPAFELCSSLSKLKQRIEEETPEYDRWGIHALVSQTSDGALTFGDSHEYGLYVDPFNKQVIDDLILRYTHSFLQAPDMTVVERWYGVYAKHPEKPLVVLSPAENVRIVASPGGSGMTLSFGVAERSIKEMGIAEPGDSYVR